MPFDGIFLRNITNEISSSAKGTRVEKVHQPSREELVISLRSVKFSSKLYISVRPNAPRIQFISGGIENPEKAPMFCMLLRKHIGGAKILSVEQNGFERVVSINLETRNEMGDTVFPSIIVELIPNRTNIILVDGEGRIIDALKRSDIESSKRLIQPGSRYTYPERAEKIALNEQNAESIAERIVSLSNERLSDAVLRTIDGISPLIAREIAFRVTGDCDSLTQRESFDRLKCVLCKVAGYIEKGTPFIVLNKEGIPVDFSYMDITQYSEQRTTKVVGSFNGLLSEFYLKKDAKERIFRASSELKKLISNLIERTDKKEHLRRKELKKCERKEEYRIFGELIKANIHKIRTGQNVAEVENYYDPNCKTVLIPLNVGLSPAENAQRYFKEYKKANSAERMLEGLIKECIAERRYLETVQDALERAENPSEINEIRQELIESGYIKSILKKGKQRSQNTISPKEYVSSDGFSIFVGRNNSENDRLTLKFADKTDIWLHTKNIPGSHVIIAAEGKPVPQRTILEAAVIAAYNSKASNSSGVPVDYTLAKFVKKPSGARPGMVIFTDNKTLFVTPDEAVCERLLKK